MYHMTARFDYGLLDEEDPFEIDGVNGPHLAKHPGCDIDLLYSLWESGDGLFFPSHHGPADWFLFASVAGVVYMATLMPAESGATTKCRPIGLMEAPTWAAAIFKKERRYGAHHGR